MKHSILPFLLALILGAGILTACNGGDGATADEAVNRVYPEGEGRYYESPTAADVTGNSSAGATGGTAAKTTAGTTGTTKATASGSTVPTAVNPAVTSPQPTVQSNVPNDNVSGDNINPNIGDIQNQMAQQIDALAVQSIALNFGTMSLEVGESKTLEISFNPAGASNKSCTVETENGNVKASISGSTVTVTGSKAGTCTVTVTSANGHKATCDITIKHNDQSTVTDDTVLPHDSLVTVSNVERMTNAVINHLKGLGMTRNANLQGESFRLTTDGLDNVSFNNAVTSLNAEAEDQALSIAGDWSACDFNCVCKAQDNGEFAIIVVIHQN